MLRIERNSEGKIIALHLGNAAPGSEPASLHDEEVLDFLRQAGEDDPLTRVLQLSDAPMVRVLEDLIDLLVRKKLILYTDLPEEAQEKIHDRQQVRKRLQSDQFIVDDVL